MVTKLKARKNEYEYATSLVDSRKVESEGENVVTVQFRYRPHSDFSNRYSRNLLTLTKRLGEGGYSLNFVTFGNLKTSLIGELMRKILMQWSIERGRIE